MFSSKRKDFYNGDISFTAMQFVGIWMPSTWNSQMKIICYRIYSFCTIIINIYFVFSLLIYILHGVGEKDVIVQNLLNFTISFSTFVKMVNIIIQRKRVDRIMKMLFDKICQPGNINESQILQSCSHTCRYKTQA